MQSEGDRKDVEPRQARTNAVDHCEHEHDGEAEHEVRGRGRRRSDRIASAGERELAQQALALQRGSGATTLVASAKKLHKTIPMSSTTG